MSKQERIALLKDRKANLENRTRDNAGVVRKLTRQIRNLEK